MLGLPCIADPLMLFLGGLKLIHRNCPAESELLDVVRGRRAQWVRVEAFGGLKLRGESEAQPVSPSPCPCAHRLARRKPSFKGEPGRRLSMRK